MHPEIVIVSNVKQLSEKQKKANSQKSDSQKALAAAKRAMADMKTKRHLEEPDQLASGRSDKNGNMVIPDSGDE